ncbi:hypothetical protein D3C80_1030830 [compost metagenome]
MREEGGDERSDQCQKHGKAAAIGSSACGRRGVGQRSTHPQAQGQDDGWNDQAGQQLPIAELAHLVKCPGAGSKEYQDGNYNADALAQEYQYGQHSVGKSR